jgi:hypothetical protein
VAGDEDEHAGSDGTHGHHNHGEPGNAHADREQAGELPDASGWLAGAQTASCPACGAAGALTLGGGVFCPTCGEVTTNPGYQAGPGEQPAPGLDSGAD